MSSSNIGNDGVFSGRYFVVDYAFRALTRTRHDYLLLPGKIFKVIEHDGCTGVIVAAEANCQEVYMSGVDIVNCCREVPYVVGAV